MLYHKIIKTYNLLLIIYKVLYTKWGHVARNLIDDDFNLNFLRLY